MDYYLENPKRLQGQPKKTLGDYVEQNGILVPVRFASLDDARKSGKEILLRSEHTQEYDGVSGLLESFALSEPTGEFLAFGELYKFNAAIAEAKDIEEIKRLYFGREQNKGHQIPEYKQYCLFQGIDPELFCDEVSFSIWEKIEGYNRIVIADSAISGLYHVMTIGRLNEKTFHSYAFVQDGKIEKELIQDLPEELAAGIGRLIETYEAVRNLSHFDPNHCPIMEFQTHNGKDYFLQYHRTRDFSPTLWTMKEGVPEGYAEAIFVRGATGEQGMRGKVTVRYSGKRNWEFDTSEEDGSYDFHWTRVFSELQVRRRKIQMIDERVKTKIRFHKMVVGHTSRSQLFKPEISIVHNLEELLGETEFSERVKTATNGNTYLDLHVISDGRRACVRIM